MKKGIIAVVFCCILFFIFGCEEDTTMDNKNYNTTLKTDSSMTTDNTKVLPKETMPDFENTGKEILIGVWSGIPVQCSILKNDEVETGKRNWSDEELLEQYQWMKDVGINLASCPIGYNNEEHNIRMLEAAQEVGIKQMLWDTALNSCLADASLTDEEAIMQARRLTSEYAEYDSYYGTMYTDEPNSKEFEEIARAYRRYKMLFPDKMFYVNMFPIYATSLQTGEETYKEYIEKYFEVTKMDYFCYDNYPLIRGKGTQTILTDNFLYNFYAVKEVNNEVPLWTFLQSMGFGNKKDPDCTEDFRIQINCSLSMGCDVIQWFCYYSPLYGGSEGFVPAIITLDGKKTEKYDFLKEAMQELHNLEKIYTSFKWVDVMTNYGSENAAKNNNAFNYFEITNTHERIDAMSSTYDFVMGVFKDEENRDGFMLTNYDIPSSKNVNHIVLNFNNTTQVLCYINGTKTEVNVVDGKIELDLNASDGAFIIPLNL